MLPTTDERVAYIALALVPGIGPTRLDSLKQVCGSWSGALSAPFAFLSTIPSMNAAAATAIATADPDRVKQLFDQLAKLGAFVSTPFDSDFPPPFREIDVPPPLLFGLGRRELLTGPKVAIVGSRHPSAYGVAVTRDLAKTMAECGLAVVSGMARGLDAVAHWAAVAVEGRTIGVLGNGLGVIYPAANRTLYERVGREGLLLTEFPPGERPNAGSFARRNRLISALARATVVVEAAAKSGALTTAQNAMDQGKDVFGVPGPITSRTSVGVNRLIQEGATPYLEPYDVLERYPEVPASIRAAYRDGRREEAVVGPLRDDVRRVLELIDGAPRTLEALAVELKLAPAAVLQAVSELEIEGLVDREPTGFRRAL